MYRKTLLRTAVLRKTVLSIQDVFKQYSNKEDPRPNLALGSGHFTLSTNLQQKVAHICTAAAVAAQICTAAAVAAKIFTAAAVPAQNCTVAAVAA